MKTLEKIDQNLKDNQENKFNFNIEEFDELHNFAKQFKGDFEGFEKIDIKSLLNKICVSRPYFAFDDIYKHNNLLIAPLIAEQLRGNEDSQITIGECGRHMAILGTCSASLKENEKYYYLVESANINNECQKLINNRDQVLIITKTIETSRRNVSICSIAIDMNSNILYSSVMSFSKIKLILFQKLFKNNFRKTSSIAKQNPYKKYLDIIDVSEKVENNKHNFLFNEASDDICLGHFKDCPSIPTAFFAYNLMHYISNKYIRSINKKSFIIVYAKLDLFELMFPEKKKFINVSFKKVNAENILFKFTTLQNDKNNSEVDFMIKIN